MKKSCSLRLSLIIFLLIVPVIMTLLGCAPAPPTSPAPAPTPTPAPGPSPTVRFDRVPDVVSPYGERTEINLSFTNEASGLRTISPFPPEIRIIELPNLQPPDSVLRAFHVGKDELALQPGESASYLVNWNQKDDSGEQVSPGWYSVEVTLASSRGSATRVLVLPPEGVMEKTIEVNQSQTVNGITITLERVELTATGMKVYAFNTPPDYNLPQGPMLAPPMFMIHAEAEYSIDGGAMKQAFPSGIRFLENGMLHTWDEYLDPVPKNSHELTFRITKLGDWEGTWEFTVSIDSDNGANQNVTFSQLISQANRYNGKIVTLEAFFFYAILKIKTLADSVGRPSSDEGKVVPVGTLIGVRGDISQALQNQLYTQDGESSKRPEYFGKVKITGKFETGVKDGDADTYQYLITVTSAEVLEWMPPPAGTLTPGGNLQLKIKGYFGNPLKGAEVVSSKQPDGQSKLSGLTDSGGEVTFGDIKQGGYGFTVSLADYIQMDIKVTVTGGRTTSVAFGMARVGEAPDDIIPGPGRGPFYRANGFAEGVVNPWPPIESTTVTLGTSSNTTQITYRDYIESEASQTRNNIFYIYRPDSGHPSDTALKLEVTLKGTNLPSGITVTKDWQSRGPSTQSKTGLKIEILQNVKPGEYVFGINVEINGKDYGTVPCTVKVLE